MPTHETLGPFIARVEQNAHAEAVEEFYAVGSSMQERSSPASAAENVRLAACLYRSLIPIPVDSPVQNPFLVAPWSRRPS